MQQVFIMGIVNCTPDSFYDGGVYDPILHAKKLVDNGADIIDIGGESSRPGAIPITIEEELHRLLPVIAALQKSSSIPLSVDTCKPEVAIKAIEAGASWINDITGFKHPYMREIAASSSATLCLMHMQGDPLTMQHNPNYKNDIISELNFFFSQRIELLLKSGVTDKQIVIDPGIGFGKTTEHILTILKNLDQLKSLGYPILIGTSRKSFLSRLLNKPPSELLAATITINALICRKVDYLRVHDVKEHRQMIDLLYRISDSSDGIII